MVQGYYTLQEAAQVLAMPPEELKAMAQRNQIRSFQDRGTWRFRVQDIQELARQRGASSDMELVLGDVRSPQPKSGPKSGPRSPTAGPPKSAPPKSPTAKSPRPKTPDVFDFAVDTGHEHDLGAADTPSKKPGSKKPSPQPEAGSDSDVKLVGEPADAAFVAGDTGGKPGSDSDVKLVGSSSDSDVKLVQEPGVPRTPKVEGQRKSGLGGQATPPVGKKPSKLGTPATPDSGVRLVPKGDSDSDVKIIGATDVDVPLGEEMPKVPTDSDIRLESAPPPSRSDEGMLTEEIDLDAELRKQQMPMPQAKVKPKSKLPKFPQSSPFELGDSEVHLEPEKKPAKPDSSDYDLTPGPKADDSSDDFSLELPDDSDFNVQLGDSAEVSLKGPSSGISIQNPVDSGISLEQGGEGSDEIEFELSLDGGSTPKPAPAPADSDSEFELSLDVDDSGAHAAAGDSSSEFELTLDDPSGSSIEQPQLKAGGREKDIFETDFDVPNLEDESGSQVAALDTDLDSSDFDLALQDSDIAVDDESGSQVVALDEEAEEGAATVSARRKPKKRADLEEEVDFGGLEEEPAVEEEVEEEEERVVVQTQVVKPAPWGMVPTLVMLPCVIVMVLVGVMGFEMLQHMNGYKPPGALTRTLGELVGQKIK